MGDLLPTAGFSQSVYGYFCTGEFKERLNDGNVDYTPEGCLSRCEEISYFETDLEMCCNWNGNTKKCDLHFGFEAAKGTEEAAEYAYAFVKNMGPVFSKEGTVDEEPRDLP